MDNNGKYIELRSRYPRFVYKAYHWSVEDAGLRVWFDFEMGDVEFHPTALVERKCLDSLEHANTQTINDIVFNIGMVELVSYWKCACPPEVEVLCGTLTDEQRDFWLKLYWNGLGEFYYTNGINETREGFMRVRSEEGGVRSLEFGVRSCLDRLGSHGTELGEAYLVPIGGGKDSVVTLELLRRAGKRIRPLIMNPRGATIECARVAGFTMDEVLVIRRTIDPKLLELNAQGYLNGHTPFSAMLAFYTMLASYLSGIPNVALSNENSANESTVLGTTVNHQYSKSLEFENDFREYVRVRSAEMSGCAGEGACVPGFENDFREYVRVRSAEMSGCAGEGACVPGFNYFSFLRPLSELQIAMLFSRFTQYHDVFRSCNVGSKQDIWCGHCAKCLFAYIILSPFIEPERLNTIFGKAMLDDLTLEHEFRQLVGMEETKPFECVGTVSEVRQALAMAVSRWYPKERPALVELVGLVNLVDLVDLVGLDDLVDLVGLDRLAPIGNLTQEERQIIEQACTAKNN